MADLLTIVFYFFSALYFIGTVLILISFAGPWFLPLYIAGIIVFPVLDAFIQAIYDDDDK